MTSGGNYDKAAVQARELFLKADQEELINKFGLPADDEYLYVRCMDLMLRVSRKSGHIEKTSYRLSGDGGSDSQNAKSPTLSNKNKNFSYKNAAYTDASNFTTTLSVFDYLVYSSSSRYLTGRWVPTAQVGLAFHQDRTGGAGFFEKETAWCEENAEKLPMVFERLGGKKMPTGDISYKIMVFDELPLIFQYWEGDEEFPSRFRLLWDENVLSYVHYETLYYISELFFRRLSELAHD